MPKLYYTGVRRHAAEPDPWQLPGKQDKGAIRVDIPSNPEELAVWLNERAVTAEPSNLPADLRRFVDDGMEALKGSEAEPHDWQLASEPARPKVPGFCDACGRSAAGTLKLALGNDVEALEDWAATIQADNLWALTRAAEIIRDRARKLNVEYDERTVQ